MTLYFGLIHTFFLDNRARTGIILQFYISLIIKLEIAIVRPTSFRHLILGDIFFYFVLIEFIFVPAISTKETNSDIKFHLDPTKNNDFVHRIFTIEPMGKFLTFFTTEV